MLAVGIGWSILEFGSLRQAWLYAGGVRLDVVPAVVQVADGRNGEMRKASFRVRNLSSRPLRILGADASCGCVSLDRLPLIIPPRLHRDLGVSVHLERGAPGPFEQTVTYNTDEPTQPRFVVQVVGRVVL